MSDRVFEQFSEQAIAKMPEALREPAIEAGKQLLGLDIEERKLRVKQGSDQTWFRGAMQRAYFAIFALGGLGSVTLMLLAAADLIAPTPFLEKALGISGVGSTFGAGALLVKKWGGGE
jgi:hypothetical protein